MKKYSIKYGDKTFDASDFQCKIFDFIEHKPGNLIINASAGASKTTTIINCIDLIDNDKKIIFVAFNNDVAENIRKKVGNKPNVTVSTFHSLGFSILTSYFSDKNITVDEYKYNNYLKNNKNILINNNILSKLNKNYREYFKNIISLVEKARYFMKFKKSEIKQIAEMYGILPIANEIDICIKLLKWGKSNIDTIDFTDMIWLPNILNIIPKKQQYDWVFVDEGQDTSIAEQELTMRCFKRGTRFAIVGDEKQQINIWCGASQDALDNFKEKGNVTVFTLPMSYRCPKNIIKLAQKYNPEIIAKEDAIDGQVNYDVSPYDAKGGDMVLCRTTAPIVEQHINYINGNKKSYIIGHDEIKSDLFYLIDLSGSDVIDVNCMTSDGMFPKIYKYLFGEMEKLKKLYNLDDLEALKHSKIYDINNNIEIIKKLSNGLTSVKKLKEKINDIFAGDAKDAIMLSTVHKAKGLEADNVFILNPSLMPYKFTKHEWEVKTEYNLIYVAITRAKKTLNFIKENNNWNYAGKSGSFDKLKKELEEIAKKLDFNILNDLSSEKLTNTTPNIKVLGETNSTTQPIKKQKVKGANKFRKLLQ